MRNKRGFSGFLSLCTLVPALVLFVSAQTAHADREAANFGHVTTATWGICYARSVPTEPYGNAGRTDVYRVGTVDQPDALVGSVDAFFQELFLDCQVDNGDGMLDVAMVGLGPWPRGQQPDDDTLALSFFLGGQEVASYSTLDISLGNPEAVSCTVSHYQVIDRVNGFGRDADGREVFIVTTIDGRLLGFDVVTGTMIHTDQRTTPLAEPGVCTGG